MEIPYTVKPRPDTGLYNAKLGIWLFLASEVMLFGALFSSYVLLRVGAADGTWSMGLMDVIVGAGNTMVLIASSMFVVHSTFSGLRRKTVSWRKLTDNNWSTTASLLFPSNVQIEPTGHDPVDFLKGSWNGFASVRCEIRPSVGSERPCRGVYEKNWYFT